LSFWAAFTLGLATDPSFDYHGIMEDKTAVRALAALAQEGRLRIFRALVVAGSSGITPGVMAEALDMAAATLSFHLKELVNAGLVGQERQGRKLIYRAEFTTMSDLLSYLTDNCCQGEACSPATATPCPC